MRLVYSPAAERDFEKLVSWSKERFGPSQTRSYVAGLEDAARLVAELPEMGRRVTSKPGTRRHGHRSHILFYRVRTDDVLILRILHVHQDPRRHL